MRMDAWENAAALFKLLSHPSRLAILQVLRDGEECVCHMEAALGLRQAYISQQLMVLRQAGVDAEIANAALYDELLKVTDNPDVVQVFKNLQAASLNNHLPAFEACN